MNDSNTMQAVIEVDDSQEEVVSQRHGKRMTGMRVASEASAAGQTRAWETSHEKLVKMAERTADRYQRMTSAVVRATADTETAFNRVASASSRVADGAKAAVIRVTELALATKLMWAGFEAGTLVVAGHAFTMNKVVDAYRVARLALAPTMFTAATLGVGMGLEYAVSQALSQARQNREDSMAAVRGKRSFGSAATDGNTARILGMDVAKYRETFTGKNPAEIAELATEFSKLKDPIDKAAFAVTHFGAQAETALPLLSDRLRLSTERAYEFSSAMTAKPREALEQLTVTLHRPAEALHALADEYRALKLEVKEGISIKVAWVIQSWEEAQRASEGARNQIARGGGDPNGGFATMGGINWGAIKEKPLMSYLQVAQSAANAGSEAVEQFRPRGMVGGALNPQTVAKSKAAIDRYSATAEGLSRQLSVAQERLHAHEEQLIKATGGAFEQTLRQQILQDEKQEAILKPQVEAAQRREAFAKEKLKLTEEGVGFITVGKTIIRRTAIDAANTPVARMLPIPRTKEEQDREDRIRNAERLNATAAAAGYSSLKLDQYGALVSPDSTRNDPAGDARAKGFGAGMDELEKQRTQIKLAGINAETSATIRLLELRTDPGGEIETAHQVAALRQSALEQELDLTRDVVRYREASLQNEIDLRLKLAELQHKQMDEIKNVAAGLFDTLFTKPSEFGKQFLSTIKSAFLKPITEGLGDMMAGILKPAIFGKDGNGGISGALHGIFHPGGRGISDVQLVNGAVPVVVVSAGSSSGASSGSSSAASTFSRLTRMGLGGALAGAMAMGGTPHMTGGEVIGGGDSTAGLTQLSSGLWSRGPGSSGDLSSSVGMGGTGGFSGGYGGPGGGGRSGNPLSGLLGNLKGIDWGGLTRADAGGTPGVDGQPGTDLGNTGKITGTSGALNAAIGAGGLMLAKQGLLGSSRGTWGGVGMGAIGGAALGWSIGSAFGAGPLGAAIGGGAGLLIGLGEKIAGVETPEREAARLVKSIYGLNIDSSSTTIKQIVAMAQQSYGGQISIAVRSPQVRELIQLYADNTGQKSSLFTDVVHPASMSQSNGTLYQTATYRNGTPYTYASSLPTLGPSGGTIPTSDPRQNGATNVYLNPQQTVDLWRTGTTQAIQGDPRGVAQSAGNGNAQSAARLNAAGMSFDPGAIWA